MRLSQRGRRGRERSRSWEWNEEGAEWSGRVWPWVRSPRVRQRSPTSLGVLCRGVSFVCGPPRSRAGRAHAARWWVVPGEGDYVIDGPSKAGNNCHSLSLAYCRRRRWPGVTSPARIGRLFCQSLFTALFHWPGRAGRGPRARTEGTEQLDPEPEPEPELVRSCAVLRVLQQPSPSPARRQRRAQEPRIGR